MASEAATKRAWSRRPVILTLGLTVLIGLSLLAAQVARSRAAADFVQRAEAALPLADAALSAVIEKQRLIPLVLARDPEVTALLLAPSLAAEERLDAKLADIAADAGSAVLYVVNKDGMAIAASNADRPESFVGSSYGFREYFIGAMERGTAMQYALGTVSRRPGLYLTRRVDGPDGPLGVVVVKVEFDELEARWRSGGFVVVTSDAAGTVIATTEPEWRFGKVPGADDTAQPAIPVVVEADGLYLLSRTATDGRAARYAGAGSPVGSAAPDWHLSIYVPVDTALGRAARNAALMTLLAGLLACAGLVWLQRRRRFARALAVMNLELERRVAEEVAEREAAETRVRRVREELAQANRLSILGQITAGVAHEINQPVAAIRTYAENGQQLLDAGDAGEARDNLGAIVRVTERIGGITRMLRGFARRGTAPIGAVAVDEAIDGALALLAGRIRDAGVRIDRPPPRPGLTVLAGQIRLEQILVNLLSNALDALRGRPDPGIVLSIDATPERVTIRVADNGPGLDPRMRESLFMPFSTTKETGLGLGLVISGDLAREFGGSLALEPGDGPGATFVLELQRASADARGAAA
ncbi:two-component system C4-dicarboxylate transport sensor histidine kinase DctB [Amaricoccus macauensis]|uniref:histidine kinase n=1 Tax=Amaricoccus macauensis TaxID=57001 RepID=A0A840SVY2_9RHOB|nr:ATP-binding protein [Amaricoccus macauensis]MBB5223311.1 two-component system C4-dicarboxylate transport sensor histidine kinase DctB [Amaricoccus macauensis]